MATWLFSVSLVVLGAWASLAQSGSPASEPLRVGVAGSEPFVVDKGNGLEGISVEIWQAIAAQTGIQYQFHRYESVPDALSALRSGSLDAVVGPVSVTASRVKDFRFSQPYFQSTLSILSGTEYPSIWQRIRPFFSPSFFVAITVLLLVLALVGTLIWLAERRVSENEFPSRPGPGIANGIWLAIVTMTTVGYGDRVPKTFLGRLVTSAWMIVSLITATSLIAGIASTLTLTGLRNNVVSTAEQLKGKRVAAEANSPGEFFAKRYGAHIVTAASIDQGYDLIRNHQADAMVFDRPQLLYFGTRHHESTESVSKAEYDHQAYAFAFPMSSSLVLQVNSSLLRLEESGRVSRIVKEWLGDEAEN
jgi:polar amino acid transport system substrate-binding protein